MTTTPETDALENHGSKFYNHPRYDKKLIAKIRDLERQRNELLEALEKAERLITRMHSVVNINEIKEFLPAGFEDDVIAADVKDSLGILSVIAKVKGK